MIHSLKRWRWPGLILGLALLSACSMQADVGEARRVLGTDEVVLLSTSTCGYCRKLRADLSEWGVAYVERDIEVDDEAFDAFNAVRARGVPVLLVGDQLMRGYSRERARSMLVDAGVIDSSVAH